MLNLEFLCIEYLIFFYPLCFISSVEFSKFFDFEGCAVVGGRLLKLLICFITLRVSDVDLRIWGYEYKSKNKL